MNVDIYLEALSDFHKLWEYQNPYCEKLNFEKYSAYKEAALKIVDEIKRGDVWNKVNQLKNWLRHCA